VALYGRAPLQRDLDISAVVRRGDDARDRTIQVRREAADANGGVRSRHDGTEREASLLVRLRRGDRQSRIGLPTVQSNELSRMVVEDGHALELGRLHPVVADGDTDADQGIAVFIGDDSGDLRGGVEAQQDVSSFGHAMLDDHAYRSRQPQQVEPGVENVGAALEREKLELPVGSAQRRAHARVREGSQTGVDPRQSHVCASHVAAIRRQHASLDLADVDGIGLGLRDSCQREQGDRDGSTKSPEALRRAARKMSHEVAHRVVYRILDPLFSVAISLSRQRNEESRWSGSLE